VACEHDAVKGFIVNPIEDGKPQFVGKRASARLVVVRSADPFNTKRRRAGWIRVSTFRLNFLNIDVVDRKESEARVNPRALVPAAPRARTRTNYVGFDGDFQPRRGRPVNLLNVDIVGGKRLEKARRSPAHPVIQSIRSELDKHTRNIRFEGQIWQGSSFQRCASSVRRSERRNSGAS
jgi:hypothetical protein